MRILHIYKDYLPVCGGIENYIRVLAEAHAAQGHQVSVLCCARSGGEEREKIAGVDVWRVPRLFTFRSMPISPAMLRAMKQVEADVIHVHSPFPLGEQAALRCVGRIPVVVTHHSDVVRQRLLLMAYAPLYRRFLQRVDRIIATSPPYLDSSPWLQPHRERCSIVPLGVDTTRFSPPEQPFDGPPTILFVGRLRYYKGLDTLLKALVSLPGVRLRVVGRGPMEKPWRTLAAELEIDGRVEFLGDISDEELPEVYRRAQLFVLPANCRAEAFGTVLLEAMSSGLPCISTEVGSGTSWVVEDGRSGFVVPSLDERALANAIVKLFDDKKLKNSMAQSARARACDAFSLSRLCDDVLVQYEQAAR